jgi:hypothetical protein
MMSSKKLKSALRSNLSLAILCIALLAVLPVHAETGRGRTIKYSQQDIVPVHAKVHFSTLIVLPQNEEILDFATGTKTGSSTEHNLLRSSGADRGAPTSSHHTHWPCLFISLAVAMTRTPSRTENLLLPQIGPALIAAGARVRSGW